MKSLQYIVLFIIINLLENCTPQCTHYYLMLEKRTDAIGPSISPISRKAISDPSFKTSKVFQILKENGDCILEFKQDCSFNPSTICPIEIRPKYLNGTDEHISTTLDNSEYTTVTESTDTTFKSTPSVTETTPNVPGSTRSVFDTTPSVPGSTAGIVETTTHHDISNKTALSAKANKKIIAQKVAVGVVGATIGAGVMYFVVMKIKHMMQYGAYHLPGNP